MSHLTQKPLLKHKDIIFGSWGATLTIQWQEAGQAHPTNHQTTYRAIHWAKMAAKPQEPHHNDPQLQRLDTA